MVRPFPAFEHKATAGTTRRFDRGKMLRTDRADIGRHQPAEEYGRWRRLERFIEGSTSFKRIAPAGPPKIKLSTQQTRQGKQGFLENMPYLHECPARCVGDIQIHKIDLIDTPGHARGPKHITASVEADLNPGALDVQRNCGFIGYIQPAVCHCNFHDSPD